MSTSHWWVGIGLGSETGNLKQKKKNSVGF